MALFDFLFGDGGAGQAADAMKDANEAALKLAQKQLHIARAYGDPAFQHGFKARQGLAQQLGLDYTMDDPADLVARGMGQDLDDPLKINWQQGGGFRASPGYQYQLDEGQKALNRALAARGMTFSGPMVQATQRHAQGLADADYDQWLNRLAAFSGLEQTGAGAITNAGQQYASNAGNAALSTGAGRASAYQNQGMFNQQMGLGLAGDLIGLGGYGAGRGWFDGWF